MHIYTKDNQLFGGPIVFADLNIIQILRRIFWPGANFFSQFSPLTTLATLAFSHPLGI